MLREFSTSVSLLWGRYTRYALDYRRGGLWDDPVEDKILREGPDPPPKSFHASRTGGAARYSLLDTFRDQIRHFNAGGDFFEMHLTDREDFLEWYASVSTGPLLPPHMRIGSVELRYAIRGGQA